MEERMRVLNVALASWFAVLLAVVFIAIWIDYQATKHYRGIADFDFGDIDDVLSEKPHT